MAEWVRRRETTRQLSSTAKILSMEADKHRLSDQVGQLQSKLDRAALHRDLIVGMELQKQNPRGEWLPEWASLVQTAGGDARRKTLSTLWCAGGRVHRKRTD